MYFCGLLEEAQLGLDFILLHAGGPDLINPLACRTVSTHTMSIAVPLIEEDESSSVKISVKCLSFSALLLYNLSFDPNFPLH